MESAFCVFFYFTRFEFFDFSNVCVFLQLSLPFLSLNSTVQLATAGSTTTFSPAVASRLAPSSSTAR